MPIGYSADALVYDATSNSWSLRQDYDPDLHRVNITIRDDDGVLDGDSSSQNSTRDADEVGSDTTQTAVITDMNGKTVASGQIYDEEFYAVWDGVNPHIYIESVEIGGVHVGYIVNAPLIQGTTYTQSTVGDVNADTAPAYRSFADVPCYAPGTLIETPSGPTPVETLKVGDLIETLDHGPQAIRWVHSGNVPLEDVDVDAKPVLIAAGALGTGLPGMDLIVSPHHRMVVGGGGQLDGYFKAEAFAPAKSLTALKGIRHMNGKRSIKWVHFACERHEVVIANGCLSESLLLGPMVVNGLNSRERQELTVIYGTAPTHNTAMNGPAARQCLTVGAVRRHLAKCKKDTQHAYAKDITEWDNDLRMEQWEADRLGDAKANGQSPDLRIAC
ncbi:Hint domain-containing protein [Rhodobacteraceae bacterium KMM 6894]|nr:Hint domain-containing protein [Rhodobacteraceae bacterium KMM 6894]